MASSAPGLMGGIWRGLAWHSPSLSSGAADDRSSWANFTAGDYACRAATIAALTVDAAAETQSADIVG